MQKYFICDACKYQFEKYKKPDSCPDCGKEAVREANESEIADYIRIQNEIKKENK